VIPQAYNNVNVNVLLLIALLINGVILYGSLRINKLAAPHPDTLRLIASMFIDPSIPGQVNYEKILKFIEYAMKKNYPDL
jgi:hypothetical protein